MAVNNTQGIVLAIFGANAGGHLSALEANATANGNASLATDLSAAAGLILGVDLSSDAAFTSTVLGNLGIAEGTDGYTLASNYFTTNLAAGEGRGELVAAAVDYLLGSSVDASLAGTATSFSTRVTDGVAYSQGEGGAVFGVAQLQSAAGSAVTAGEGETFALTTSDDTLSGTAGNDTFTGTTAELSADDRIVDSSATDSDVFNLVATKNPAAMDVTNVEAVNIDWQGFGTATVDLDNVTGANVTFSSTKQGYLGNVNFDNVAENNISVGAGVSGTVTVDAIEDATVTATVAEEIDIGTGTAADGLVTVNAGAAETVNVTGADDVVVTALSATSVVVDTAWDTADITLGVDAEVDLDGAADGVATLRSAVDIDVDITAGAQLEELTLAGDGAITLTFDDADLDALKIINGGIVKTGAVATALDLHDVSATEFAFESTSTALTHQFASGANVTLEADLGSNTTFATTTADDGSSDTLTVNIQAEQTADLIFDTASQDFENVTINIDAPSSFDTDTAFDIEELAGNSATAETDFTIVSSASDVDITIANLDALNVDASGVNGELTITQKSDEALTIAGAQDDTTVTFVNTANDTTFSGTDTGDDDITFGTTTGEAAAVTGGGDNTVKANALTTGSLAVIAGDGADTVEVDAITTGTLSIHTGGGDDTVRIGADGAFNDAEVEIVLGAGDDTVELENGTDVAEITIDGGDGEDTINADFVSSSFGDHTAATITLSNVEIIDYSDGFTSQDSHAIFDGAVFDDATFEIRGAGDILEQAVVHLDKAGTYDFSGITVNRSLDYGMGGLDVKTQGNAKVTVTGTEGDDTITVGTGASTITGGAGDDYMDGGAAGSKVTFVIAGADTGKAAGQVDTVANFVTGTDVLSLGVAGSASNYAEMDLVASTSFSAAITAAEGSGGLDKTVKYVFGYQYGGSDADGAANADGLLFIDADMDGDVDDIIILAGLNAAGNFDDADIIA